MRSKILITGITGFVGSHLAEYILSLNGDYEVYGLCRWRSPKDNLDKIYKKINILHGDLLDLSSLIKIFREHDFKYVFHLAAQSYVQTSFDSPIHTLETNVIGTANLLETIRLLGKTDTTIHVCSSSEVYGQVKESEVPIKEDCSLRPASPYAVSKVGEDMLALQYYLSYGLKTLRTRMFTHTGPKRGDVFMLSFFAKQIVAIEMEKIKYIRHGNLKSIRTFCDVRDAVKAYWLLVNKCPVGEVYNIGGNRTMTVGESLDILKSLSTVKDIKTVQDRTLLRPSDVTLQIPCTDKFYSATGWKPEITFEQTCRDLLDYWRNELKVSPWKIITIEK